MSQHPIYCNTCGTEIKSPPARGYGFCDGPCMSVVETSSATDVFALRVSDLVIPPAVAREAAMLRAKLCSDALERARPEELAAIVQAREIGSGPVGSNLVRL